MSDEQPTLTDKQAAGITRVDELSYELSVDDVMTRNTIIIEPDESMLSVLDKFKANRISGAPVLDQGELAGIVSMEDLIRSLRENNTHRPVSEYMTRNVLTIRNTDQVIEALKVFNKTGVGRLPVVTNKGQVVGMLTKGDVSNGLLSALQRDIQSEELIRYRASHLFEDINSDRSSLILRYKVEKDDFVNGGSASNHIKKALLRLGATPLVARTCGIAAYEAEMNLIIHTLHGGTLRVEVEPDKITMEAYDDGPGIPDIDLALQPGFSTASEEVRGKGFGAGMGLVNIRSCVDEMRVISSPERGTNLYMFINVGRLKPGDKSAE